MASSYERLNINLINLYTNHSLYITHFIKGPLFRLLWQYIAASYIFLLNELKEELLFSFAVYSIMVWLYSKFAHTRIINCNTNANEIIMKLAFELSHSIITYDEKPALRDSCEAQNELVPF
jgi:hypothetical protein